jgi:hypothetical protein
MFTSAPQVTERFASILEATMNSKTGRKFTGGATISFGADEIREAFPSLTASGCTACFVCRFPELRAIWFATAISVSLLSPDKFDVFYGNVTSNCMTNGSYYTDVLCGPRGAEDMPFSQWSQLYSEGYAKIDIDVVQAYAGLMVQRAAQMGGAAGGEDAALALEAGNAWFYRNPALPMSQQAARFNFLMCRVWRKSDAGQAQVDEPQKFDDFASGSLAHISSSWAYETCKRFKHEVFGGFSRSIHNFALEVAMCFEVRDSPRHSRSTAAHCSSCSRHAGFGRVQEGLRGLHRRLLRRPVVDADVRL